MFIGFNNGYSGFIIIGTYRDIQIYDLSEVTSNFKLQMLAMNKILQYVMAAPKQSRSLIVVSNNTSNKTNDSHYKHEIFIGNLRYDLSSRALITYIQELFKSINVDVPSFRFTIFQRKTKKQPPHKYAFVTLANEAEEERTYQFDDTENLDFVIDGRKLSIKRRTSSRHKQNKNIKMTFDGKVDKLKRSKSVPGLHTRYNCDSITEILNENALKKEYYLGQHLSSEDRFTEYKRGAGNYIRSVLISHIRRYICAFLNSKGIYFFCRYMMTFFMLR